MYTDAMPTERWALLPILVHELEGEEVLRVVSRASLSGFDEKGLYAMKSGSRQVRGCVLAGTLVALMTLFSIAPAYAQDDVASMGGFQSDDAAATVQADDVGATVQADDATAGAPEAATAQSGDATLALASATSWHRLWGPVALDTMNSIVESKWSAGGCDTVIVATMDGYWDALTASGLAGLNGCPVLITNGTSLSSQTAAQISRLDPSTVYVIGGTAAVSTDVESQIQALGAKTKRVENDNAVGTAIQVYDTGKGSWGTTAILATSDTYQDALSASPYAYAKHAPIFLTQSGTHEMDQRTRYAIENSSFENVIICGGTAAISDSVDYELAEKGIHCKRLGGATAYETSATIAQYCIDQGMNADKMGVATGEDYYDALTGASFCGANNSALVLVSDSNRSSVSGFISSNISSIANGYVFGGTAAVSKSTFSALEALG